MALKTITYTDREYDAKEYDTPKGSELRMLPDGSLFDDKGLPVKIKTVKKPVKQLEKDTLKFLCEVFAQNAKTVSEVVNAMNLQKQIEASDTEILIDNRDLTELKTAFEKTAGKRPPYFFECIELFGKLADSSL